MAPDTTDGCIPSKMGAEEMEVGSEPVSQSQDLERSSAPSSQQSPVTINLITNTQDRDHEPSQSHSQPATQPLDFSVDMEPPSQDVEAGVWGQLYPHCGTFPRIPLKADSFRFGRASSCDYVIRESDMGDLKWCHAVSKVQCEIIRKKEGVFVKDKSSNGTWVNDRKIGKDLMLPLLHNDEIFFAGASKKVFVFMSTEEQAEKFPAALTSKYTVSKVLGRGAVGEVRLGFRIPDLHRVAIKIVNKRTYSTLSSTPANRDAVLNEVRILRSASHPCIIHLEDVVDTPDFLYIVLELAEGGELFDKIIEKTKFNEAEAKLHFYQMISAISYLHSKNICHRDLKPENILLCSTDEKNPVIKITDMGLSKLVDLGTVLKTFCGTPQYIAPEIVTGAVGTAADTKAYSLKVDCWSLGVILYVMVSGTPPFSEDRNCGVSLKEQILTANYVFYPQLFDQISDNAKDLIKKCLKVNPQERISAEEIMNHPWLKDNETIRRAKDLMSTQIRGKKRLLETEDEDSTDGKRPRSSVFKTPNDAPIGVNGVGGVFNPPGAVSVITK